MKKVYIAIIAAITAIIAPMISFKLGAEMNSPIGIVALIIMFISMAVFIYIAISEMTKTTLGGMEKGLALQKAKIKAKKKK